MARSRFDIYNRAKKFHFCINCKHTQGKKFTDCPVCGSRKRIYFRSEKEFHRALELISQEERGEITALEFTKRFPLNALNGEKVGFYECDSCYMKDGKIIVEDVKARPDIIEPLSNWKIKHFNAQYGDKGMKVKIVT